MKLTHVCSDQIIEILLYILLSFLERIDKFSLNGDIKYNIFQLLYFI